MSDWHISRGWHSDPFAPECGCVLLECGHVSASEASKQNCDQHGFMSGKTIRSSHTAPQCDQDFARTALPEEPDYVYEGGILGEDEYGYIFAEREGETNYWERFDRRKRNHIAAYEATKATGRLAFLELEHDV